jgi:FkbM family methyltransferase
MYSQYLEERYILEACAGMPTGRFLDIGAWNPRTFSNTRALYERDWSGVMIEPSPEPFLSLLKEYGNDPRITLIMAAVGFERCCIKFHASADAVSTATEKVYENWKKTADYQGTFWTPVLTFADLVNQFGGPFNFINIDTEGSSVDLFLSLDWRNLAPLCICVEHDNREGELLHYAQQSGYQSIHVNGTNMVLARMVLAR